MTLAEEWLNEGYEKGLKQAEGMKKQAYCQGLSEGMQWLLRFKFGNDAVKLMPMLQTIQEPEILKKIEQGCEQSQQLVDLKALIEQYLSVPQN